MIEDKKIINNDKKSVNEEPLFNFSPAEDLAYTEPVKQSSKKSSVYEQQYNGVREESLTFTSPKKVEEIISDVETEVLFDEKQVSLSEEQLDMPIQVKDEGLTLQEESLSFSEPIKLNAVSEETLFDEEEPSVEVEGHTFSDTLIDSTSVSDIVFSAVAPIKVVYEDKKFAQKILEQEPIILNRYVELKNIILSYKKVKSRISNNYDSFNMGRLQLFKLATSGKSLKLYLNLDINEVESRLKCKDVSNRNCYKEVPVLLRIKSERAMRNAKYLIDVVAKKYNLVVNKKYKPIDAIKLLKEYLNK